MIYMTVIIIIIIRYVAFVTRENIDKKTNTSPMYEFHCNGNETHLAQCNGRPWSRTSKCDIVAGVSCVSNGELNFGRVVQAVM